MNPIDIHRFEVWKQSGRGLLARPVLPNNIVATRDMIDSISYAVYDLADVSDPTFTGNLVVADVMLTEPATWTIDTKGYTFLWGAPGSLWPNAGTHRIIITFNVKPANGGYIFIEVYEATAKDPLG